MTTILNSLQADNVGIQVYNTDISAGATPPGRGVVLYHTNGNIYCVYGQTYNSGENRSLYFSVSLDQGFTWSAPAQITSGNWDDDPALIQNDTTNTSSAINIAFTRIIPGTATLYVYVATLGLTGSMSNISPVNNGTGSFMTGIRFLNLNQITTNQFLISGMRMGVNSGYPVLWSNNSSSFTAASWNAYTTAMSNLQTAIGSHFPVSFRLRKISSGNYIAIFAGYTTSNAATPSTVTSVPAPQFVLKTDLYYCSSTDGAGITWNSAVNMTSYAGTPQFDMVSFPQALDADLVQLNDGSITVIFSEGYGPQYFDSANEAGNITSPSLNSLINNPSALGMNRPCNNLLLGGGSISGGGYNGTGFFTFNTSTQEAYRFAAGIGANNQQIGANHVTNIAISADGNYVAITTTATYPALGTLEVFYTGGSGDPSTWVLNGNTNPSMVGTIPLPSGRVPSNLVFQDNAFLLVGWVSSGTADVAFSRIDCSNLSVGFTDITMSVNVQSVDVYHGAMQYLSATSRLYFTSGSSFVSVNVTTGSAYDISVSTPQVSMCYDDVNNQWILNYNNSSQITIITDNGASLSSNIITNSALIGTDTHAFPAVSIPGGGMLFFYQSTTIDSGMGSEQVGYGYYAFGTKTWYSAFEGLNDYTYQRAWGDATGSEVIPQVQLLYTAGWVLFVTHIEGYNLKAVNVTNTGRLRIGNGTYSSGILTINTFYDAVNQFNLGIQGTAVLFPNLTITPTNGIVMAANEMAYAYGARPITVFTGVVAPNSQTMQIGAKVRNKNSRAFTMQARCLRNTTQPLNIRAFIAHEHCIKMQAHIAPYILDTITMRATILASQQSTALSIFNIQATQQSSAYGLFYINTGAYSTQGINFGAYIARRIAKKATVHFTIPALPDNAVIAANASFNATSFSTAQIGIKTYIV